MKWTTRSHLHLDRTASAWLIQRFVDPSAEFRFVDWAAKPDETDPQAFGMPGIELSGHDPQGTCFAKIMTRHDLQRDAALVRLERAIAAGVRQALGLVRLQGESDAEAALGSSLDHIGAGFGILYDDEKHLAAAIPLYDAIYTFFRLGDIGTLELPGTQPERVNFLRGLLSVGPTLAS